MQVDIEFYKTKMYALVFDEQPVYPSIATTLVYNILAKYPYKSMKLYTQADVAPLQAYVEKFLKDRNELFGIEPDRISLDLLYRFYQNGLSNNPEFFTLTSRRCCAVPSRAADPARRCDRAGCAPSARTRR